MSDERLRELERQWKESGAAEDEFSWLVERVRAGELLNWEAYLRLAELDLLAASEYLRARVGRNDLSQENLELAAYCLHEPARLLVETVVLAARASEGRKIIGESPSLLTSPDANWAYGLPGWGEVAPIVAAVAAARLALPAWTAAYPGDVRPQAAIDAAAKWIAEQTDECLDAMVVAAESSREAAEAHEEGELRRSAGEDPDDWGRYDVESIGRAAALAGSCYSADDSDDWVAYALHVEAHELNFKPVILSVLKWALQKGSSTSLG